MPSLKPLMTSSKISSAPCFVQSARSAFRNSGRCSNKPLFAGTGSMMTAAMRSPSAANSFSAAAVSSSGSTRVSAASSFGTPCEDGWPNVASPEPAATSK